MTSTIRPKIVKKSFNSSTITQSNYYYNGTIDVALSGCTPIAIAGYQCNQTANALYKIRLNGNTLEFGVANTSRANLSGCVVTADILYI